jgi:exopolyphosphatase/guanosine-5'-triphosphate,3'-diphosphate pyrophosphatase
VAKARYAVISAGTNSCRLLIATADGDALHVDYHESRGTRLGADVDSARRLNDEAISRTLAAVRDYAELARGAAKVFGIATSALRDAQNAADFARDFERIAGVPLRILTGEEEAQSSFAGVLNGFSAAGRQAPDSMCVVDVGGGSTEFAARSRAGAKPAVASLQIGAVRLTEKYLAGDPPERAQIERCRQAIRAALDGLEEAVRPRGAVVAVGGTANTAARMLQLFEDDAPQAIVAVPVADLRELLKATLAMPISDRKRLRGLPAQRADIFPAGLMIVLEAAAQGSAATILVSGNDLLLGFLSRALSDRST